MTTTTSDSTTTETEDRLAIVELIGRLALLLDARDWDALEQVFTDTVYSDPDRAQAGPHILKIKVKFHKPGHAQKQTVTKTVTHGFSLCTK